MRALAAAISTLTVLPFGRNLSFSEAELRASILCFPFVGLAIGAALSAPALLLHTLLPSLPLAALTLLVSVLLTGGLHLDGLADLCDGLGAGGEPQRILSVMKDSYIGAFGAIGLILTLVLKFALFYEVIDKGRFSAFLLMGILSRWAMAFAAFLGKYPRETGTGKAIIGRLSLQHCVWTSAIAMIFSWITLKEMGFITLGFIALWTLLFVRRLHVKIGGLTGDGLGTLNETAEVLALLILVIATPFMDVP